MFNHNNNEDKIYNNCVDSEPNNLYLKSIGF